MENIIDIIQKHSLTVRCLPYEVISCWNYKEGDENIKYVDSNGNEIKAKREVIIQDFDLKYFQETKLSKWNLNTPEERFKNWKKNFPNGRKLLKETKTIEHGGWWLVKETKNTNGTIIFNRKHDDTFYASTIEEAIQLYLDSK